MPESAFTTLPEIADRTYLENELAFAFLTKQPITPGHSLIAPKRVVDKFSDLTTEEELAIFSLAKEVRLKLESVFGAKGFNYAWNEGKEYGQSVPHFHLHIVPRTKQDSGISQYEPRQFLYRPGSREDTPENELRAIAKLLK